jgi:hypothetical protein
MIVKKRILLFVFVSLGLGLGAQELPEAWEAEQSFRQTGMLVLGSWATANIVTGLIGRSQTEGSRSRFYEMNAIWNSVNLGIAVFGYISAQKLDPSGSAFELYKSQQQLDRVLLINAGLDIAYMATGLWMRERSKNISGNPDLWLGYGNSIILQGAFLFVFDLAMFGLHQRISIGEESFLEIQSMVPGQLGLSFIF